MAGLWLYLMCKRQIAEEMVSLRGWKAGFWAYILIILRGSSWDSAGWTNLEGSLSVGRLLRLWELYFPPWILAAVASLHLLNSSALATNELLWISRIGLQPWTWRQLPTQCDFAGSGEETYLPTHVPKYLLYQLFDVWDCFPLDKAFHFTMKDQK